MGVCLSMQILSQSIASFLVVNVVVDISKIPNDQIKSQLSVFVPNGR